MSEFDVKNDIPEGLLELDLQENADLKLTMFIKELSSIDISKLQNLGTLYLLI